MKTISITLLSLLLTFSGFSQAAKFELNGRPTPAVKKENLRNIQFVHEIIPDFWSKVSLPEKHLWRMKEALEHQRTLEPAQTSNMFPQPYRVYPQEYYDKVVNYVSIEIATTVQGKSAIAKGPGNKLTAEQKNMLNAADMGADILVKVKYQYQQPSKDEAGPFKEVVEGKLTVTVVPATEAEFPGGFKQITEYFTKNVIHKSGDKNASSVIQRAIMKFTVNEEGRITDVKLWQKTEDSKIDKLLLEAMANMPNWKPAADAKGNRVKQKIVLPFGGDGC